MSLDRFPSGGSAVGVDRPAPQALAGRMAANAPAAAAFLKALSHEGRLMILCHLAGGEKAVAELEALLGERQAAVSQQLAGLRLEGLVSTRRDGKAIYYAVHEGRVLTLLRLMPGLFAKAA